MILERTQDRKNVASTIRAFPFDNVQLAEPVSSTSMNADGGRKVSEGPGSSRVSVDGGPTADQRLRELTPSTSSLLG